MKRPGPGDRVFAILATEEEEVQLLGFGVYIGDEVPPHPVGFVAAIFGGAKTWDEVDEICKRDGLDVGDTRHPNPKIQLDGGEVVWGGECWWGPERDYPRVRGGRKEVIVSIVEARAAAEAKPE